MSADAGPCPLSFTCPTCHAKPGEWCKRPSEHRAPELHADRLDLEFAEADLAGRARAQLTLDELPSVDVPAGDQRPQLQLSGIDDVASGSGETTEGDGSPCAWPTQVGDAMSADGNRRQAAIEVVG